MTPAAWAPLLRAARTQRRLVARLVGRFGPQHLALAEEAVQTALLRALERWPCDGLPDAPEAWLYRTAQHSLIDQLRRGARQQPWSSDGADGDSPEAAWAVDAEDAPSDGGPASAAWTAPVEPRLSGDLDDDELALLLAACHPALPPATQVALALRTLAALPLADVAAALLTNEAALAQRLARARRLLAGVPLALPAGEALGQRREAALTVLSLLFLSSQQQQAHAAATNEAPPSRQAGWEAIRLARGLAAHPATAHPDADALAAVLLLHGARLSGRIDDQGQTVPLPGQARDRWDQGLVRLGLLHLQRAQRATQLSRWHLLAGVAAEHATAPSYGETRWSAIVRYYEALVRIDPSVLPGLGHAIALVEAGHVDAGRLRLEGLKVGLPAPLQAHRWAALARADELQGRWAEARQHLGWAVEAAVRPADARLLAQRLAGLPSAG